MLCDAGLWGIIGLWSFNCLLGPHGSAGCCSIVGLLHLGCDDVVVMVTHFYFAQWEFVDLVGLSEPQKVFQKRTEQWVRLGLEEPVTIWFVKPTKSENSNLGWIRKG